MPEPADPTLYASVKRRIYKKIPTHSAYRSGTLVSDYKQAFREKHGNRKRPYKGKRPTKTSKGLKRWFAEEWTTEEGSIGYSKSPKNWKHTNIYRPTKRITKETPKTHKELSKKDLVKAKKEKFRKGRVKKF